MKKLKYFLVIGLLVILTTGCVKFNANMDIKKDKSMDFTIIYALDKTVFGDTNKLKEEDFKEASEEGFTLKKYTDGNYEGFTLTKKISNIDEVSTESDNEYNLSGMMSGNDNSKYLFKVVKGENKNTYYAKFKFDANDSGLNSIDEEETLPDEADVLTTTGEDDDLNLDNVDLSKMMGSMDLSFNVTLPYSATKNNATKTENNNRKLTWTLSSTNQQFIEFEFELNNNETNGINMMYVYIGIGVILLAVIVVLIVTMSKKKNVTTEETAKEKTKVKNTNK